MFLGLRTVIYPAPDLEASKEWFSSVLGLAPYFDEPFYAGFDVGGYELGLNPAADPEAGAIVYWGVTDIREALGVLMGAGAQPGDDVTDVGEGILLATVHSPGGHLVGIIENPHFTGEARSA